MRLLWQSENVEDVRKFSAILRSKKIEHTAEQVVEKDWGSENYGVPNFIFWITDEDRFSEAEKLLSDFLQHPGSIEVPVYNDLQFSESIGITEPSPTKRFLENKLHTALPSKKLEELKPFQFKSYLTNFIVLICSMMLFMEIFSVTENVEIPVSLQSSLLTVSPVEKALLFDYPESNEILDKLIATYGYTAISDPESLPAAGKVLYKQYLQTPSWKGIYTLLVSKGPNKVKEPQLKSANLFEKIRQGEVWRLITPIFLHGGFLHLFFNMIWLLILGTQMEKRLKVVRYFSFIVIVAIISNICQYIVSGPAFIGYSGVVCGMVFFIRGRQKVAAWESYTMTTPTFNFILFFIGTLAALSILSFILDFFHLVRLPIAIANTAHIAGAVCGWMLSKSSFFAMKS